MGQKIEICSQTINHQTENDGTTGGERIQSKNYNL